MSKAKKKARNPRVRSDGCAKDVVYSLDIDQIRANASQPRKDFDVESIIKLADSIRRYGILQPLTVRRVRPVEEPHEGKRKKNLVADVLAAADIGGKKEAAIEEEIDWGGIYVSRETEQFGAFQLRIPDETPLLEESGGKNAEIFGENTPLQGCQPNSVFVPDDTCQYELVAGERRLRAAKMLGMRRVPCIIMNVSDALSAELALVENMLRENLNMFEQAEAFLHLSKACSLTQEEIAGKMSLSQSAVANKMRLLRLEQEERDVIAEAGLTERHARALLRIADANLRKRCLDMVVAKKMNVAQTDQYITDVLARGELETREEVPAEARAHSPEQLCSNIYKFINRMQAVSGNCLVVNRRSDDKNVVITLTVKRSG